jgi:hypothetical protein
MRKFLNKLFCFRAFSSFEYGSEKSVVKHDYRVTGFIYVYTTSDNQKHYIHVPKWKANCVSGYGICGVIVPFNQIRLTEFKIKKRWHFFKVDRVHTNWLIEQDKEKYKFYKSLPEGLSSKEIQDITIDQIMKKLCPEV